MYTDGITEAKDISGNQYDIDGLKRILKNTYKLSPNEIKTKILDDVNNFSQTPISADDKTLLVVGF